MGFVNYYLFLGVLIPILLSIFKIALGINYKPNISPYPAKVIRETFVDDEDYINSTQSIEPPFNIAFNPDFKWATGEHTVKSNQETFLDEYSKDPTTQTAGTQDSTEFIASSTTQFIDKIETDEDWPDICFENKTVGFPFECTYHDAYQTGNFPISRDKRYVMKQNHLYGYYEYTEPQYNYRRLISENAIGTASEWDSCIAVAYADCNDSYPDCFQAYVQDCNKPDVYSMCLCNGEPYNFCDNFRKICASECDCAKYDSRFYCESKETCNNDCSGCREKFNAYPTPVIELERVGYVIYVVVHNSLKVAKKDKMELYCFSENPYPKIDKMWQVHDLVEIYARENDKVVYGFNYTYHGLYWCECFTYPDKEVIRSEEYIYKYEDTASFILNVSVNLNDYNFAPYNVVTLTHTILLDILYYSFQIMTLFIVRIHPRNSQFQMKLSFRINLHSDVDDRETHEQIESILSESLSGNTTIIAFSLLSANTCFETVDVVTNLTFPATQIGRIATPDNLIVDKRGLPIRRQCLGSYTDGAYWGDFNRSIVTGEISSITDELTSLLNSSGTPEELNDELWRIIVNVSYVIPWDIHLISGILTNIVSSEGQFDPLTFTNNINEVMKFPQEVLSTAQQSLNSTDTILYAYDLMLGDIANMRMTSRTYYPTIIESELILAQVANIDKSAINGIAVYKREKDFVIESLIDVRAFSQINLTDLLFATYLPQDFLELLCKTYHHESDKHLVTALYLNDALFDPEEEKLQASYVLSMFVPNFEAFLYDITIPMFFNVDGDDPTCAYWKYGYNDQMVSIIGSWEYQNDSLDKVSSICNFNHMTHFTLLVNAPYSRPLNIINDIASALSMLGAFLIIITAIFFSKWRGQSGTPVLLNYSVTVIIQHFLLIIFDIYNKRTGVFCTLIGVFTHYIVLVQFCWMLLISYVQYLKLVVVLVNPSANIVIKFCLFAWMLPVVPVTIVVIASINDYNCFLIGNGFYFGLVLPVFVIIIINLVIFAKILKSLYCSKTKTLTKQNEYYRTSVSIILFFLMGFTWIFGFMATFLNSLVFSYIFCISTASHGIVIFIYFILLQKQTRRMWLGTICKCFDQNSYNTTFNTSK